MKSAPTFSALACVALATSAAAFPTPAEPLFVPRMVRRQLPTDPSTASASNSSSSCGDYALQEPQQLQVRSYNDSTTAYLSVTPGTNGTQLLTALPASNGTQRAFEFDFQTCNYQNFTQGFSRNSGGSMGAPIEYWGRVVTNVTTSNETTSTQCVSAVLFQDTAANSTGMFQLSTCNDTDSKQWFRLQEGIGGATLSYFPVANETDYVYTGQTPEYFSVDLHPEGDDVNTVEFTSEDSQEYILFD